MRIRHRGDIAAQEGKSSTESRIFAKEILEQVPQRKHTRSFFPEGRESEIGVDPTFPKAKGRPAFPQTGSQSLALSLLCDKAAEGKTGPSHDLRRSL